jgi:transcriptional regulator with XRE-family HTH domain
MVSRRPAAVSSRPGRIDGTAIRECDAALGRRIHARRRALRISQIALARAIGVSVQQVQKYENGSNRISFSRLVDIARALNERMADLVGDSERPGGAAGVERRHLVVRGARDLLRAYQTLPQAMRPTVVNLLKELALADDRARHGASKTVGSGQMLKADG